MRPDTGTPLVAAHAPARASAARCTAAVGLAALAVALSAQVVVPVPLSPVPMTLQPLAVLAVGGLLGARDGAAALVLYLVLGITGLPVFAGGAAGAARLVGPTGGYLLAFPLAAMITGAITGRAPAGAVVRVVAAGAAGMAVIHAGGVAQLALLGGDAALAVRVGFLPFLPGDLLKVSLAAAVILLAGPAVRRLL